MEDLEEIMIITPEKIKEYIDKCKVINFAPNSQGIIDNDELSDDIDEIVTNIINSIDENMFEIVVKNKLRKEVETATIDNTAKILNIFYATVTSIYNYIISKYFEEKNTLKNVLGNITNYSLELFTQIFSLYLANCTMGILSQIRILYENYIIFNYIGKHSELAECYLDHAILRKDIFCKEYWRDQTKISEDEMNSILSKYDETFDDDFGWTFKIIKERNKRKLITMVEDLDLLDYSELYKVSSNYIHPSPFSVFHTKIINGLVPKYIIHSIEMITNQIIHLMEYYNSDDKDKIIIRNVLYGLREDLYNEPKVYKNRN
jgi:hypothetical protein